MIKSLLTLVFNIEFYIHKKLVYCNLKLVKGVYLDINLVTLKFCASPTSRKVKLNHLIHWIDIGS